MNYFSLFSCESDNSSGVITLYFFFVGKNLVVFNGRSECERFVEFNYEVILEVFGHTTTVSGCITNNLVLFGHNLYIGTFIESIDNNV